MPSSARKLDPALGRADLRREVVAPVERAPRDRGPEARRAVLDLIVSAAHRGYLDASPP